VVVACVAAAMVLILSFFNGIEDLVDGLYNKLDPDITISATQGKVLYDDSLNLEAISKIPGVYTVSSTIKEVAILSKGRDRKAICKVLGVDKAFGKDSTLKENIPGGRYGIYDFYNSGPEYVIPGAGVASDLNLVFRNGEPDILKIYGYKRGKRLSSAKEKALNENVALASGAFTINAEMDLNYTVSTLEFARKVFDYPGQSSYIGIELEDQEETEKIQNKIKQLVSDQYLVKSRRENNPLVYETNESEKKATSLILSFVMLIAIFNGMASLTILISEKRSDIGVLKSMGATKTFIKKIFMLEGVLINVLGAIAGIALGLLICLIQNMFGLIPGDEGSIIESIPLKVEFYDIVWILATVIIVGIFATFIMVNYLVSRFSF